MKRDNHRASKTDGGAEHDDDQSTHSNQLPEGRAGDSDTGQAGERGTAAADRSGDPQAAAPAGQGTAPAPASGSRSGVVLASISLIAVIAAVAAGFGVWRQSEDQQQRLAGQVQEAQASANAAQAGTDDVKQGLASVRDSVDSLSATVKSLKSTIESSSSGSQTGLAKRVTAVEKQIRSVQGDVKANRQDIGATRQDIKSVQGSLSTVGTNVESLQSSLKSVSGQIKAVDDKLSSQLDSAVSGLQKTQHSLQHTQQSLTQSVKDLHDQVNKRADRWKIDDAEYLVHVASQRLQLAGDTQTAIRALEGAEQRLKDMGDPSLLDVRKKVTDDIVALQAVPRPDITGMALTLSGLAGKVDDLPVAGVNPQQALAAHTGGGNSEAKGGNGGWSAFWSRVWSQMKSLVVVRHKGSASEALVPPDQRFFLKENLKLKLEAARLALLRGDYKAFHDALATADQWLGHYFKTDAAAVDGVRASLKKLAAAKVQPQLPDLSGTLKALRDWRATHMSQSAALDEGPDAGRAPGTA